MDSEEGLRERKRRETRVLIAGTARFRQLIADSTALQAQASC